MISIVIYTGSVQDLQMCRTPRLTLNTKLYTNMATSGKLCNFAHMMKQLSVINSFDLLYRYTSHNSNQWLAWLDFRGQFISCLEVVTTHVRVIVEVTCTWRYTRMYDNACLYVCKVLRVFHKPQACHMQVFCVYTFCMRTVSTYP